MTPKQRILELARELFLTHGYSKVSMNDIAGKLGMSKKTLYNNFSSKEGLLQEITKDFLNKIYEEASNILKDETVHFPERITRFFTLAGTRLSSITPFFLEDISRNAPDVWNIIQEAKQEVGFRSFYVLLDEGIKKGYIKKNINKSLAVLMYSCAIETIINPSFTRQIPLEMKNELPSTPSRIFEGLMEIIFEGIAIETE